MKGIFVLFIFVVSLRPVWAQQPDNINDLHKIYQHVQLMSADDEQIIHHIVAQDYQENDQKGEDDSDCKDENKKRLKVIPLEDDIDPSKIIVENKKTKPQIRFYYKVIAPVEDIKNTSLDQVDKSALKDDFKPVIQAQDEATRDAAIKALCEGKSTMERVQLGSALFNMLSDVYNYDMTGGRDDIYSSEDPTKNPDQTQTITIQRQYNALNEEYYGGTDFVAVGGVCRHAAVAVTDFLKQCGLTVDAQKSVGYRTAEGGHATVKVVDPDSGKTYFLSWGELIESESLDPMANFDIPSKSLKETGMLIQVYDGDSEGKRTGTIRNPRGTFIARVLGVADDEIDVSTYTYNETGAIIDLGSETTKYANGKTKEVNNFITTRFAHGSNINAGGFENKMWAAGAQWNRESSTYLPNGIVLKGHSQISGAYFNADESLNLILDPADEIRYSQGGFGMSALMGGSIKKNIMTENSFHSLEAKADLVTEVYVYDTKINGDKFGNKDGAAYTILGFDSKNRFGGTEVNAGVQTNVGVDKYMSSNDGKINLFTDNTKSYVVLKQDVGPGKISASYNNIASVEKNYSTVLAGYEGKKKFNVQTGITVMKYNYDDKAIYQVLRVGKEFNSEHLDIDLSAQASIPLKNKQNYSTPYAGATIVIVPKFGKR